MVKRFIISVALLIPVILIAQIDWTKQLKNVPSYVANALGDPGAAGIVKRTTANTSTVAGSTDVWPGTVPFGSVTGTTGAWPGTIPFGSVTVPAGTVWPGNLPYSSLTSVPNLLGDPGSNGVVYRNGLGTTAAATGANLPVMVASGASHSAGAVPDPGAVAGTSRYLREDGTWSAAGGGVSTQTAGLNGGSQRTLTGTYQNTTGKPMSVTVTVSTGTTSYSVCYTDSNSTPATAVAEVADLPSAFGTMSFWVLPNNYYKCIAGGTGTAAALILWTEWN